MAERQKVPDDFPRAPDLMSISGSQAKVGVQRVNGKYIAGPLADDALWERYSAMEDLAQQLALYCLRKAIENPTWSTEFNMERMSRGVTRKRAHGLWIVSELEYVWLMKRVREIFE